MIEQKIIMEDSPEAAQLKTLSLWVDRLGYVHEDERSARYASCTHRKCTQCGGVTEKYYLICKECMSKKDREKYKAMPFLEWDGKTPLCIFGTDEFFFDEGEIEDYCEENEIEINDLELVICVPTYAREIDADMFLDQMPDNIDVPEEIEEAIRDFNLALKKYGQPLLWSEGRFRTSCAKNAVQDTMEAAKTAANSAMLQGLKPHAGNTGTSA